MLLKTFLERFYELGGKNIVNTLGLIAFGPIPSRRLGRSLGINNIPPKNCSYSCVYCQVGRAQNVTIKRQRFYRADDIYQVVEKKIFEAKEHGENIDYLTFASEGEPTLDINLGIEMQRLKAFGISLAVITNSSLMGEESVREDLARADLVSIKIDAATEDVWRKVNRPHKDVRLDDIFKGISEFAELFKGTLITETMLVKGMNDVEGELEKIADIISGLKISKSYVSVPTRPPAEKNTEPADEKAINSAYNVFREKGLDTEILIRYEGDSFAFTGKARNDLLSIMSVHPMRKGAIEQFLLKADADWDMVESMIKEGVLRKVPYRGLDFYMRTHKPELKDRS